MFSLKKPTINKNYLKHLLKSSTRGVEFSYNSHIYSQHDGIATRSPLGPTLAKIFMGFIEPKIISSFKYELRYFIYINNNFRKKEEVVDELFTVLNEAHSAIKLIVEKFLSNDRIIDF